MSYPPPNNPYPQQGGYPPQGYPPQQTGYPPQQGGYPPPQGYPPQQYPPQGYPPQQTGYPPQQGGYPPPQGYPPQQTGYPPQQYPPQTGYPPHSPVQGHPVQGQPGYPPQTGYPPVQGQPGYPPQTGYPPVQGHPIQGQPGYPPQQVAYPPQGYPPVQGQPGYPPVQGQPGFPPQQVAYPPQQGGIPSYYISSVAVIPPFNGEPDAEALYKAMKGLGTNDSVLSNIVATRTRDQLQEIKKVFEKKYGKSLESWIKGETSGHYEDLLRSLIQSKDEYDAMLIKGAVKGLGTNDEQLVEAICTRNNSELKAMKAAYQRLYHVDVEKDVADDTSGDYKNLLLAILRADRPEAQPVNVEDAKRDAQRLYHAGEGRVGTDEKTFIAILTGTSLPQLHTIANVYSSIANHSLESGISKETSGNFKKAMIALITPKEEYFATKIHDAISGTGTDDKKLIRCLSYISTSKDLCRAVNQFYTHRWKHTIVNDVGGDTSGWYGKTAKALIANRVNL